MKRTKNRKATVRRERIIMLTASAFVLASLVGVGVYMNGQTVEEQDNGYQIDFAQLESNITDQNRQLAEGPREGDLLAEINSDDALDYMPMEGVLEEGLILEEADSGQVEIGEKEDIKKEEKSPLPETNHTEETDSEAVQGDAVEIGEKEQILYNEASGLYMPVNGDVLMHYNMANTIYFATLDQYKCNPATIISAAEGSSVYACADGTVSLIYSNEEIGNAVCIDLGNGYQVTYGQLKDVYVSEGDTVSRGTSIATVGAPTKYYSVEGSNLYFAMKKDGEPMNAENLLPIE